MSVWAAIAGGAQAYTQQRQQQQDQANWEQRYEIQRRAQEDAEKARARYLAALRPPETQQVHATDEAGKPVVQTQRWVMPSDEDIAAGRQGRFDTISTTPDIQFERLDETQRHNAERERLQSEAAQARNETSATRLAMERERLEAAKGKRSGAQPKLVWTTDKQGIAHANLMGDDGTLSPMNDESGQPVTSQRWRPRQGKPGEGDAIGPPPGKVQPVFVDPSEPMGQFEAPAQAAPKPQQAQGHGRVVRTGMKNGRRIMAYEDGSITYDDGTPVQ